MYIDLDQILRQRLGTLALLCILHGPALILAVETDVESRVREHFQAARQAEKSGDLGLAASEYNAAIKLQPDEPEIHNNLGLVYHLQAKYREAIESFKQALKRNPPPQVLWLFMAVKYLFPSHL